MSETTAFKSCSNAGDIISFIPAMRKHYTETGKKVILYLWLNRPMIYPDSNEHPVTHNGEQVSINRAMFNFIRPLLLAQDFMYDVREWQGEEIKVDFDRLKESFQIMPYGSLNRYIFYLFPDLSCDLSKIYISISQYTQFNTPPIIITRTSRYRNYLINYFFLKPYEREIIFVGLKKECTEFCKEYNLNIEYFVNDNADILAQRINTCRFFISNQTMAFQIAEGLKVPRILERCPAIPNVIPIGENAYDFHYQLGLETHFKTLYEQTK